jgi:hypothetical protein
VVFRPASRVMFRPAPQAVNQQLPRQLQLFVTVLVFSLDTKTSSAPPSVSLWIMSEMPKVRNCSSSFFFPLCDFFEGNMLPISRVVNSSRIVLPSDPPLPSDSILVKWRPVTLSGIGSWENQTILPGGRLVAWLVSLLTEEIIGFVVQGLLSFLSFSFSPMPDPNSSNYLIHSVQYSPANSRRLSISDPGISVSIPPNKTISTRTIREYVPGVSNRRLYLLNSGLT